jgi:4-alpha-glucanotransferase
MGLQRIYCVPDGMECSRGVYVGYPADELFAILTIESHRHRAMLVGEDLGTVPPGLPEALESRKIRRMHVLEYALAGDHLSFDTLSANAVASVNTHDLVPFAGWCAGRDIQLRRESGQITEEDEAAELGKRAHMLNQVEAHLEELGLLPGEPEMDPEGDCVDRRSFRIFSAIVRKYGQSDAPLVLLSLEDLWLEREPQNVPGTTSDCGNWSRRMSRSLEEVEALPGVEALLALLRDARNAVRVRSAPG